MTAEIARLKRRAHFWPILPAWLNSLPTRAESVVQDWKRFGSYTVRYPAVPAIRIISVNTGLFFTEVSGYQLQGTNARS